MDNPVQSEHIWTRRSFFALAGWVSLFSAMGTWGLSFVRFLFPRVLFEPPTSFKAGFASEYPSGEVSEAFKDAFRVWIVREKNDSFYALLAICTHLGCTPRWLQLENKFKCPCHGSGFRRSGINFEGPAPRPLERLKITLSVEGQILIDKAVTYRQEKGEWEKPGSHLEV